MLLGTDCLGLPPYQVTFWSIQPFGHNRHGPKIGGLCGFFVGEGREMSDTCVRNSLSSSWVLRKSLFLAFFGHSHVMLFTEMVIISCCFSEYDELKFSQFLEEQSEEMRCNECPIENWQRRYLRRFPSDCLKYVWKRGVSWRCFAYEIILYTKAEGRRC